MDILSRLGARAIGTAATVKPVIAPLFWPAPRVAYEIARSALEVAEPFRDDVATPAPRSSAVPRPVEAAPSADAQVAARREPSGHAEVPDVRRRVRPLDDDVAGLFALPPAPLSIEPAPERLPRRASAGISAEFSTPARDPIARGGEVVRAATPPLESLESRADHVSPVTSRLAGSVQSSPVTPLVRTDGRYEGAAAFLERLRSLRDGIAASRPAPDPIVRVTIGRIEVRSAPAVVAEPVIPSVATTAPARVAPPGLTLAEYLGRKREAR